MSKKPQSLLDEYNKLAKSVTDSAFKPLDDDHGFSDDILRSRIDHLKHVSNLEKTKMLPKPFPSSPSIKPKHVLTITKEGDKNVLLVVSFAATYAAVAFVSECCDHKMGKLKWKDQSTVHLPHDLLLTSDTIEDLFEYELSREESDWQLPEPYSGHAQRIREGKPFTAPVVKPERTERAPREARAPRAPQASRDGLITLAAICEEIGMEPRDARMILRKKAQKPDAGWAWNEAEADTIRKLLGKAGG